MKWVDLQLLLDLRATLLSRNDPVADRWERAVPEALSGILLQGPQYVLCVLLRLIFVEQRHDLTHHDVHWIVAHLLRDRQEPNAILRQLPDVELQLEVIAEETREAMDDYDVERRWLARPRLDHALKLGAAVIRSRRARLDECLDQLQTARLAIAFALPALVGDRHVMLGLPGSRDTQIERSALRDGHKSLSFTLSARPEQLIEHVAEPCFKYLDFAGRERNSLGPIVGDGPS